MMLNIGTLVLIGVLLLANDTTSTPERKLVKSNDRMLFVRSLPGYPNKRSDLYEIHMEPYFYTNQLKGVVEMKSYDDEGNPIDGPRGILTLEQLPHGVRIFGSIKGLTPGLHGFHVHQKGDLSKGCSSAGPHFNPYLVTHGGPNDPLRHVGDLGNVEVGEDGIAQVDGVDHCLTLIGARGAIGRTIIIHEKEDDLGRKGTEESVKTGSAGARLACGIIGFN